MIITISNYWYLLLYYIYWLIDISASANISKEHLDHAHKWGTPVDCTWIIRAEEDKRIYLQVHRSL